MRRILVFIVAAALIAAAPARADWPPQGVQLFTLFRDYTSAELAPDAAGGGAVAFAQALASLGQPKAFGRVDAAGSGLNLLVGDDFVAFGFDGAGGFFTSHSIVSGKIEIRHRDGNGSPVPGWPTRLDTLLQFAPNEAIRSDGLGGAFVVWNRSRTTGSPPRTGVVVSHILANGTFAAGWPAHGVVVQAGSMLFPPVVAPDGAGGAMVAWENPTGELRVQHVLATGGPDPAWPAGGVLIPSGFEYPLSLFPSGDAWILVVRSVVSDPSLVRAHRFSASGVVNPGWTGGVTLLSGGSFQRAIAFADGAGGAYAFLEHGSPADVAAAHVQSDGTAAPGWTLPGSSFIGGPYSDDRAGFGAASDGAGGFWFAHDVKHTSWSTRVRRVSADGTTHAAWPDTGVTVQAPGDEGFALAVVGDGANGVIVGWTNGDTGDRVSSFFRLSQVTAPPTADVPENHATGLAIQRVWPNPARGELSLALSLAPGADALLELLDVSGRVRHREPVTPATAFQTVAVRIGAALEPGLYFVRVSQGGRTGAARVVIAR